MSGGGGSPKETSFEDDVFDMLAASPKRSPMEGAGGQPGAKRRKVDAQKYFELEAEEADGSEEAEDAEDLQELIDDSGAAPSEKGRANLRKLAQQHELKELAADMDNRGTSAGAQRVFGSSFLDAMEEKYKKLEEAGQLQEVQDSRSQKSVRKKKHEINTHIVPHASDPKLWVCKTYGPEKEIVLSLLGKSKHYMKLGKQVPVFSIFFAPHLKGFIYIEAFKEAEIRDFVRGIHGISVWQIRLVPSNQMTQVFTSAANNFKAIDLAKTGDIVRLKRGAYKGDLGIIVEIKDDQYTVKMKPRLDLRAVGKARDADEKKHRRKPVPRWFNRKDVEAAGLVVNTERRQMAKGFITFDIVDDEAYLDGYVFKTFKHGWFQFGDTARPSDYEKRELLNGPADVDEKKLMPPPAIPQKLLPAQKLPLEEGDIVIVNQGDMKNFRGIVTKAMTGWTTVHVRPLEASDIQQGQGDLSIGTAMLSKYFEVGDQVKIIAGEFKGDTGWMVKMIPGPPGDEWGLQARAKVLLINCRKELDVFIDVLRRSNERPEPQSQVGEFYVEQLVKVSGLGVGLLVRLELGDRAWVLLTTGHTECVSFGELDPMQLPPRRRYEQQVWTADRKGNRIKPSSMIWAPRSRIKTKPVKAQVLFIHGTHVFFRVVEELVGENALLVSTGDKCEYMYDIEDYRKAPQKKDKAQESEAPKGSMTYGIQMASETTWMSEWAKRVLSIDDKELSQQGAGCRIVGGDYKGLRGEVRAHLGDYIRISLLCKPKLVTVPAENVRMDDMAVKTRKTMAELMVPRTPKAVITSDQAADHAWNPRYDPNAPPVSPAPVAAPATPASLFNSQPPSPAVSTGSFTQRRASRLPPARDMRDGAPPVSPAPGAAPATPASILNSHPPSPASSNATFTRRRASRLPPAVNFGEGPQPRSAPTTPLDLL